MNVEKAEEQRKRGLIDSLAIGQSAAFGWEQAVARQYADHALDLDSPRAESLALKEQLWTAMLETHNRWP